MSCNRITSHFDKAFLFHQIFQETFSLRFDILLRNALHRMMFFRLLHRDFMGFTSLNISRALLVVYEPHAFDKRIFTLNYLVYLFSMSAALYPYLENKTTLRRDLMRVIILKALILMSVLYTTYPPHLWGCHDLYAMCWRRSALPCWHLHATISSAASLVRPGKTGTLCLTLVKVQGLTWMLSIYVCIHSYI